MRGRTNARTEVTIHVFASGLVDVESIQTQAYWQASCSVMIETKRGYNGEAEVSFVFWTWPDRLLGLLPFFGSSDTTSPRARSRVEFLPVQFLYFFKKIIYF